MSPTVPGRARAARNSLTARPRPPRPAGRTLRAAVAVAAAAAGLALPRAAAAQLTQEGDLVESMLNALGTDAINFFAEFGFGPVDALPVRFSVDPAGLTFTYSTLPGSTYRGLPASIVASGGYVAADDVWRWAGTVSHGPVSHATAGVLTRVPDLAAAALSGALFGVADDPADPKKVRVAVQTTIKGIDGAVGIGEETRDANGDRQSNGTFLWTTWTSSGDPVHHEAKVKDSYDKAGKAGAWEFVRASTGAGVPQLGVGLIFDPGPVNVGHGAVVIAAVPEPTSVATLGAGLAALVLAVWRRRRAAAA